MAEPVQEKTVHSRFRCIYLAQMGIDTRVVAVAPAGIDTASRVEASRGRWHRAGGDPFQHEWGRAAGGRKLAVPLAGRSTLVCSSARSSGGSTGHVDRPSRDSSPWRADIHHKSAAF